MGDRQTFQMMPSVADGTPGASRTKRALPFRHEKETARPHYYGVTFENGLKAEMAPTDHAAMMRFTYPGDDASVIFDNVSEKGGLTLDKENGCRHRLLGRQVRAVDRRDAALRVRRLRRARSRRRQARRRRWRRRHRLSALQGGQGPHGQPAPRDLADQPRPGQGQPRPGDPVRHLLRRRTRTAPRSAWDGMLGKVEVEGASEGQRTTLYSSLYRLYLYPNSGFEKVGSRRSRSTSTRPPSRRRPARTPRPTPARRSSTASRTSTTASGTPTARPGPRTPSSPRRRRASWSTASSSSTRTAAGSRAGPRPAMRT